MSDQTRKIETLQPPDRYQPLQIAVAMWFAIKLNAKQFVLCEEPRA
jgi:hypothetical protein